MIKKTFKRRTKQVLQLHTKKFVFIKKKSPFMLQLLLFLEIIEKVVKSGVKKKRGVFKILSYKKR